MPLWTENEASVLVALQRGIPICERPFEAIAIACKVSEDEVLDFIRRLMATGDARRFGAVFDARRLGYRSALCAMHVPADALSRIAERITVVPGITHAYERGWPQELAPDSPGGPAWPAARDNASAKWPNLWFTLATPSAAFDPVLRALRDACQPFVIDELPALRRFKIDVVFDVRTRDRDERVEPRTQPNLNAATVIHLDPRQQEIVQLLQGDLPIHARFFAPLADQLGIPEAGLSDQLRTWQTQGVLRRIAILLRHREIGFKANGMCCWSLPPEKVLEAGRCVSSFPEVTHCYERPSTERFPFRLYAMIHTSSWRETQALFQRISEKAHLPDGQLLLSLTEFKKTSMSFDFSAPR